MAAFLLKAPEINVSRQWSCFVIGKEIQLFYLVKKRVYKAAFKGPAIKTL